MQAHPKFKFIDYELNYGRPLIKSFIEKAYPTDAPAVVIDLGAGQGDDLSIVAHIHPNSKLYALETYKPYIEKLESKGISVFNCDLEKDKLPFDDESVDVIIMNQIMEHVKEVFWILHEVSRVLKPNGHFIVGVPNLGGLQNRVLLLFGHQPSIIKNNSAHVRGYTKADFVQLLYSGFPNGFKLLECKGSNFYPLPPLLAKPLAKIFPLMSWAIFMNFKKVNKYDGGFIEFPKRSGLETNFYTGENEK